MGTSSHRCGSGEAPLTPSCRLESLGRQSHDSVLEGCWTTEQTMNAQLSSKREYACLLPLHYDGNFHHIGEHPST